MVGKYVVCVSCYFLLLLFILVVITIFPDIMLSAMMAAVIQADSLLPSWSSLGKAGVKNSTQHYRTSVFTDLCTKRWKQKLSSQSATLYNAVVIAVAVIKAFCFRQLVSNRT